MNFYFVRSKLLTGFTAQKDKSRVGMIDAKQHIYYYKLLTRSFALDCVHTKPAHFENGEKCDG